MTIGEQLGWETLRYAEDEDDTRYRAEQMEQELTGDIVEDCMRGGALAGQPEGVLI